MQRSLVCACVLLLSALSGVLSKEEAAQIPDFQDATIPVDIKESSVSHDNATASAGVARAAGAESSTARTENVETSTGQDGEAEVKQGQTIATSTGKRNHTIIDPVSVKILRGEKNGIVVTDMALPKSISFFNYTGSRIYSVDYHYAKKFVFYTALSSIFRDDVVGRLVRTKPPKVVVFTGLDGPVRLAVDWVHDRLYWMSLTHRTVEVADLDGGNRTLLFDNFQDIKFPNNIAVDPNAGYLFMVSNYSVYRAGLDGANLTRLHLEGEETRGVKCLALDTTRRRIYYSGKKENLMRGTPYIASCDYNGESVQEHPLGNRLWNDIFSLDVFRDTLYFAHYSKSEPDTIYRVDLKRPGLAPALLQSSGTGEDLNSLRVYHPGAQQDLKGGKNQERVEKPTSGA